jgi:glycosyltransferase involved in cell wall biosynthesis
MREYTNQYEIECWNPERMIKKPFMIKEDYITYRIFPASKFSFPYKHFSMSMLNAVREECKKVRCLLYMQGIHGKWINIIPLLVRKVPIVAQHHGEDIKYRTSKFFSKPWKIILASLECRAYQKVDHFFMLYPKARDELSKFVPEDKISIQTSGIDFNIFRPYPKNEAKRNLNLKHEKRYLLYVGMLGNHKGIEFLFRALPFIFTKYPDVELLLIGKSRRREYVEMLKGILHSDIVDRVKFMGEIKNEELPLFYNASDLFIFPSIKEGVPHVLMEAAACNLPFIATAVGGIPHFAEEVGGGILIEPGSSPAITQAIDGYLSRPPLKINLRENARKHDWDVILKTTFELIEKLEKKYYSKPLPHVR